MPNRIAVIGGGIVGTSSALHLLGYGFDVTLIDPVVPGDPAQTSFGNAGILAREGVNPIATPSDLLAAPKALTGFGPYYLNWRELPKNLPWFKDFILAGRAANRASFSNAMNALLYDTIEQHHALAKGSRAQHYIKEGLFSFLYRNDLHRAGDTTSRSFQKENGVEFELVDRAKLVARDPNLSTRYTAGVDFHGHGWITNPSAYLNTLYKHFKKQGGRFQQVAVETIGDKTVILTTGKTLNFDQIILSAGAWSAKLLDQIDMRIPLRSERGYHLSFTKPSLKPPHPYLVMDRKFGFTPMQNELRAAGNTDFSSLDRAPKPRAHRNLLRFVRQLYPNLSYESYGVWTGSRPTLSDGLPAIGRVPNHPSIICAFGSQHLGLTMGPKLGSIVAKICTDQKLNMNMQPYSPKRFS